VQVHNGIFSASVVAAVDLKAAATDLIGKYQIKVIA
jgi:hypothetical protein